MTLQNSGRELGPGLRIPDGRVVYIGATNHNAIYNPATNSWAALADTPGSIGANDAPGALLPNGHILYGAGDTSTSFNAPTTILDMDPVNNTISTVTGGPSLTGTRPYTTRMLMLPTGQVLFTFGSTRLWIYTPDGIPQASWRPTVGNITYSGSGVFTHLLSRAGSAASYSDASLSQKIESDCLRR